MNNLGGYGISILFVSFLVIGTLVVEGTSSGDAPPGFPVWDKPSYKIDQWGKVTIEAPEQNIDSQQIDIFYLLVDSDSDSLGVVMEMVETGSDTNIFSGSVLFTSDENSSEGLYVIVGDMAYVSYGDFGNSVIIEKKFKPTPPFPVSKIPSLTPTTPAPSEQIKIPNWIRDNARWWAQDSIEDQDFVLGIQYLIEQKIMIVPSTDLSNEPALPFLPNWIKDTAGWWADGKVSDDDFVNGIQYLVSHGIIVV